MPYIWGSKGPYVRRHNLSGKVIHDVISLSFLAVWLTQIIFVHLNLRKHDEIQPAERQIYSMVALILPVIGFFFYYFIILCSNKFQWCGKVRLALARSVARWNDRPAVVYLIVFAFYFMIVLIIATIIKNLR